MSASSTDLSSSSISSTGHIDGLGRRSLSFDRETGGMLERVHLRPELAPFESIIRDRIARLQALDNERFARPVRIERDGSTGELTVLSEFVTGSRLSDLLEATADQAIVPGVDVALGYLLEALPALARMHVAGVSHGLIDVSRTVLTPDGRVVFLDSVFGAAVEHLHLSRQRLWAGFGIAAPSGDGAVHLDAQADIAQVALGAVALVLGRNLRPDEYPDALTNLLMEVVEVAQIRGSAAFATGFQRLFQRALPLPGRRPFTNVDETLGDVRQLVRRDLGLEVCRQAVVDFARQMDAAFSEARDEDEDERDADSEDDYAEAPPATRSASTPAPRVPELDRFLDNFDGSAHVETAVASDTPKSQTLSLDASDDETELSLDNLELDQSPKAARDTEEIYDLSPIDTDPGESDIFTPVVAGRTGHLAPPPTPVPDPEPVQAIEEHPAIDLSPAPAVVEDAPAVHEEISKEIVDPPAPPATFASPPPAPARAEAMPLEPAPRPVEGADPAAVTAPTAEAAPAAEAALAAVPAEPVSEPVEVAAPATVPSEPVAPEAAEHEKDTASSRRRKRQQQKSARARKDKLRSSVVQKPSPPPPPEPPKPASPSGWLVSPQRAAQFEPPVPVPPPPMPMPVPPPPPARPVAAAVPAVPSFSPTLVGSLPQPVYPSGPHTSSGYGTPSAPAPAKPGPLTPPPVVHAPQSSVQVKVKADHPTGFTPKRPVHSEPPPVTIAPDRFGTLGLGRGDVITEEPRAFPWKLAAVAVAVAVVAILIGRTYLPGRSAVEGEPGAPDSAASASPAAASPAASPETDPAADGPIPAGRGRLVIKTDPPGIRVLLDRKPIGETPIKIDVPPGRRMLTFMTTGGEVIRSVRVAAGKTETLDIPVFSGWVSVIAPVVLNVAADGKNLGSTEQSRLILPPGKHELTLTNKELGYTATQEVEIEPGEVKTVSVDPKGSVNLNAAPWAEVWLDGQKLGDTPLASTLVPLGIREFVFKNPQYGERKVSTTIKAANNAPVTVDFSK